MVQLSNLCMSMEKTIALTIQTFVGKVISLLFNILSRFVTAFLSRSKTFLISWLQSSSCSDFGAQGKKICDCFHIFPFYLSQSDVTGCHVFLMLRFKPAFSLSSFILIKRLFSSSSLSAVQSSSVAQSCPTLCDPMNHSMSGLPVHHQLSESTPTQVHRVSDATQPSHPLSSPSPPALSLSQHQGLFHWVSSSHQVAKVLEFQLQHQSFQWIPRTDLL